MTDADEARAILLAAGADPALVRVEQTSIGWLVAWRGVAAGATDQTNQTMDTPQEVARAIVAALPKNSAAPPSRTPSAASEPASDEFPPSDAGALAPEPEQVETPRTYDEATAEYLAEYPEDESDGETGEALADKARAEESVVGSVEPDGESGIFEEADAGVAEASDEPSSGVFGSAGDSSSAEPLDADFEAIEELGAQDDLLADDDFDNPPAIEWEDVEEPPQQDGPIAYGASTIDGLIREKLGRVSQIARELKSVLQEGWTVEEYAYLQNLMVRMDRGEAPDDPVSRERFLEIAQKSQAMSRIDAVRDRKEGELEEIGQRRDFDAAVYYEPSEGWPA